MQRSPGRRGHPHPAWTTLLPLCLEAAAPTGLWVGRAAAQAYPRAGSGGRRGAVPPPSESLKSFAPHQVAPRESDHPPPPTLGFPDRISCDQHSALESPSQSPRSKHLAWRSLGRVQAYLIQLHFSDIAFFYQLKACGNPAANKSSSTVFPTAFSHFAFCATFW